MWSVTHTDQIFTCNHSRKVHILVLESSTGRSKLRHTLFYTGQNCTYIVIEIFIYKKNIHTDRIFIPIFPVLLYITYHVECGVLFHVFIYDQLVATTCMQQFQQYKYLTKTNTSTWYVCEITKWTNRTPVSGSCISELLYWQRPNLLMEPVLVKQPTWKM